MRRHLGAFVVLMLFCTFPTSATADAAAMVVLTPPVEAPILDPFRLPEGPYGPGNRGIEYDTESGEPVRAAAGGVVVFAGAVAGSLHVTVDHGGGMLSSYSFVERMLVGVGQTVGRGDRVALAGPTFHFGVRVDGQYVDPASLMGRMVLRVRLIPGAARVADPVILPHSVGAEKRALVLVASDATPVATRGLTAWHRRLAG